MDLSKYDHKIFALSEKSFEPLALEVFRFQYVNNPVYHDYINALGVDSASILSIEQIPFLPIRFFKSHSIKTTAFDARLIFESSGTTGSVNSRHFVKDLSLYEKSFTNGFEFFYGPVKDWCIIGLLPSYLERGNSSLVYMVNDLIKQSHHSKSGFYLGEYEKLFGIINELEKAKQKTILIGVTFALLDFAEKNSFPLHHTVVMETGGMKGRRDEMIREEVHAIIKKSFGVPAVQSEYGMTELLSQAYSKANGIFLCPPWMKVAIRDEDDPLFVQSGVPNQEFRARDPKLEKVFTTPGFRLPGLPGAINIIDLANIYSCSFIATDDAGKLYKDGSFEVLGRIDNSDIRGCSLMMI
jgi:phenylacetate-coenzyme A ligase PaaK-like adenylate-forming protein